jgi:hypothetical protein
VVFISSDARKVQRWWVPTDKRTTDREEKEKEKQKQKKKTETKTKEKKTIHPKARLPARPPPLPSELGRKPEDSRNG